MTLLGSSIVLDFLDMNLFNKAFSVYTDTLNKHSTKCVVISVSEPGDSQRRLRKLDSPTGQKHCVTGVSKPEANEKPQRRPTSVHS